MESLEEMVLLEPQERVAGLVQLVTEVLPVPQVPVETEVCIK